MAARMTVWDSASCPDAETLAAFLDNRLSEQERDIVAGHLAACEACYFTFTEAARMDIASAGSPNVVWWKRRRVQAAVAGLAMAASLALAVGLGVISWPSSEPELEGLVAAVGTTRLVEPRLTGGFTHGPLPGITRSGQPLAFSASPDVRIAAAKIDKNTTSQTAPPALRARAIAALMIGNVDAGVLALEQALLQDADDPQISSDLAAAYLIRGRRQGDSADWTKALAAADRAIANAPTLAEAHFNRALALERLGRTADARQQWQRYLEIDADSGWADEVRVRLRDLSANP